MVRLLNIFTAAALAAALLLSYRLKPDPRGLGTHEQLLLHPCNFYSQTGLPCPSCGMTTAFAHMARAEFRDAFLAQPLGALGFLMCILFLPVFLFAAFNGSNPWLKVKQLPLKPLSWLSGILFLLAWVFKLSVFLIR